MSSLAMSDSAAQVLASISWTSDPSLARPFAVHDVEWAVDDRLGPVELVGLAECPSEATLRADRGLSEI